MKNRRLLRDLRYKINKMFDERLLTCRYWSGAKVAHLVDLERCWQKKILAKIGVDTAENEPEVRV